MSDPILSMLCGFLFMAWVIAAIWAATRKPALRPVVEQPADQQEREWHTTLHPVVPLQREPEFEPLSASVLGLPSDPADDTFVQRHARRRLTQPVREGGEHRAIPEPSTSLLARLPRLVKLGAAS